MTNDEFEFDDGQRVEGGIYTATELWCTDRTAAKAQYGPIASWDTSEITTMGSLFVERDFNDDISRWDVSACEFMGSMFCGSTFNGDISQWDVSNCLQMDFMFSSNSSFTRQLTGAWSTSTASKREMFFGGTGSIAGKTNNASGTPE